MELAKIRFRDMLSSKIYLSFLAQVYDMETREIIRAFKPLISRQQYNTCVHIYDMAKERGDERFYVALWRGLFIKRFGEPPEEENLVLLIPRSAEQIEVLRDPWGIPHVFAGTDAGAF